MKKYIITFIVCLLSTLAAKAQNSIDNLVERYSSSGGSSFTTAVKRNPQTQKVVKVVKTLETDNGEGNTFYRAFKREARTEAGPTRWQITNILPYLWWKSPSKLASICLNAIVATTDK